MRIRRLINNRVTRKTKAVVINCYNLLKGKYLCPFLIKHSFVQKYDKLILFCGQVMLDDYWNLDISESADIVLDLEKNLLAFPDNSLEIIVCISAINYFTRSRAQEIIKDVYRVLKPGGIARFGVQDMKKLAKMYLNEDREILFQRLPDGRERFEGETLGDKFIS